MNPNLMLNNEPPMEKGYKRGVSNLCQHTKPIQKLQQRQDTRAAFQPSCGRQIYRSNGTNSPSLWTS